MKLNQKKIKELSKELNLHDAGLIEKVLCSEAKNVNWTPRQLRRIARIKKIASKLDVIC